MLQSKKYFNISSLQKQGTNINRYMRKRIFNLKNYIIPFFLLMMLFFTSSSNGQDPKFEDGAYTLTKNTVTINWDETSTVDYYDVWLIRDISGQIWKYQITTTGITIAKPMSGVFTVEVRAAKAGVDPSDWCQSTDAGCAKLITGVNGAWKIRWRPSGPIGPIIIK
jgi:hypothetical protein